MSDRSHGSTAIITPVYRPTLSEIERDLVLASGQSTLHPRFFVIPEAMDSGRLREEFPESEIVSTRPENLASIHDYNQWMTSTAFYDMWSDFSWILLCQMDALVRQDPWQRLGPTDPSWDYLGAPWNPEIRVVTWGSKILVRSPSGHDRGPRWVGALGRKLRVGNGGLSLRRMEPFRTAARLMELGIPVQTRRRTHEDVLWAAFGPRFGVRFAREGDAARVFWESIDNTTVFPKSVPVAAGYHAVDKWPDAARMHVLSGQPPAKDRTAPEVS